MVDSTRSLFESLPASSCNLDMILNILSGSAEAAIKRKHRESTDDDDSSSDVIRHRRPSPVHFHEGGVFVLCLAGDWIDAHREALRSNPDSDAAHHLWIPKQGDWLRDLKKRPHRGDVIVIYNRTTRNVAGVTKVLEDANIFLPRHARSPVAFPVAAGAKQVVRVEDLSTQILAPEKPGAALLQELPRMVFRVGHCRRLPDTFILENFLDQLNDT